MVNFFYKKRWNIFFYLYSEKLIEEFTEKNRGIYTDRILIQLKMSDLFINSNNNFPNFPGNNLQSDIIQLNNNNISYGFPFNNIENNKFPAKQLNIQYNNTQNYNETNISNNNFQSYVTIPKKFQPENSGLLKTTSDIFPTDFKNPTITKISNKLFVTNTTSHNNIKLTSNSKDAKNNEFITKMRRRSIKNNKIVFVHTVNPAARKMSNDQKVKNFFILFFRKMNRI